MSFEPRHMLTVKRCQKIIKSCQQWSTAWSASPSYTWRDGDLCKIPTPPIIREKFISTPQARFDWIYSISEINRIPPMGIYDWHNDVKHRRYWRDFYSYKNSIKVQTLICVLNRVERAACKTFKFWFDQPGQGITIPIEDLYKIENNGDKNFYVLVTWAMQWNNPLV